MIVDTDTQCFARLHSTSDSGHEIFPSGISQHLLQLSGIPNLYLQPVIICYGLFHHHLHNLLLISLRNFDHIAT